MQQWSAKGPCHYNQVPASYNKDRFHTNTVRGRSVRPCSTPNMSTVPNNRMSRHLDDLEQQRYGYHSRRFQHNCRQEPDQKRYLYTSQALSHHANTDTTSIMLNALENFSAEFSMQPLGQTAPGSIQEFDRKDKATTIPWLDQVKLVAERTGNYVVKIGISKLN